jgi:hypothetical protein
VRVADVERCPACNQKIKHEHEGETGPPRQRLTVSIPPGEEGVLEDLLIQFVERFKPRWEGGDPMPGVGERHWKYISLHHALYALVTASDDVADRLLPSEIGA